MFISKTEKQDLLYRISMLEEIVKGNNGKINELEVTLRNSAVINKKTLFSEAEKINAKKEKQREYSRRYYQKVKIEKARL